MGDSELKRLDTVRCISILFCEVYNVRVDDEPQNLICSKGLRQLGNISEKILKGDDRSSQVICK